MRKKEKMGGGPSWWWWRVRIPSTTFSACHKKRPTSPNYIQKSFLLLFVIIIYSPAMRVIVFGLTYVCVPHATCAQEKNLNKTKGFESWVTEWTCDRSSAFRMGQHWVEKPAAMERRKKENGILSRGNSSSCTRHNLENKFKKQKKQNKKQKQLISPLKDVNLFRTPTFGSLLCVWI